MKASPGPARPGEPCPFRRSVWPSCGALGDASRRWCGRRRRRSLLARRGWRPPGRSRAWRARRSRAGEKPPAPQAAPAAALAAAAPPPNISPRMSQRSTSSKGDAAALAAAGAEPAARTAPRPAAAAEAAHGLAAVGVDLAGVELLALLGVAHDVEGRADLLEPLLGGLVAGVGVGMVAAWRACGTPCGSSARAAAGRRPAPHRGHAPKDKPRLEITGRPKGPSLRRFGEGHARAGCGD